ncbi:MAG: hypothetical protein JJ949_10645 [Roseicyclus sp.]|nr:hypothetical protein [Roseicyclus sp.]MBO6924169.1 hypothetical protein [Roseicyclus sp.]
MSLLDAQTRALLWTAKVAARNLRAHVARLKTATGREVVGVLKQIASESELLSKSAEKLGRIDLPSDAAADNEGPPMDETMLVLAKTLRAVQSGVMKQCPTCAGYVDGGGDRDRIESDGLADEGAKARARQRAQEARP